MLKSLSDTLMLLDPSALTAESLTAPASIEVTSGPRSRLTCAPSRIALLADLGRHRHSGQRPELGLLFLEVPNAETKVPVAG